MNHTNHRVIWILPIIFAVHNIEELFFLQKSNFTITNRFPLLSDFYETPTFIIAMILLTVVVVCIVLLEFYKHNKITFYICLYMICLLLMNGMTHAIRFFIFQQYNPGLVSALCLLIPSIIFYLIILLQSAKVTKKILSIFLLTSLLTMGPIILLFLFSSYRLLKYIY